MDKKTYWTYAACVLGVLCLISQAHLMWLLKDLKPNIVALQLSFNHEAFWQIWQAFGEVGQAAFYRHLPWDFAHQVIYASLGFCWVRHLQMQTQSVFYIKRLSWLGWFLAFAGVCDLAENLCQQHILSLALGTADWHIPLAASFASIKWFFISVFFIQIMTIWRKLRQFEQD